MERFGIATKEILVGGGIAVFSAIVFRFLTMGYYPAYYYGAETMVTASVISFLYTCYMVKRSGTSLGWLVVFSLYGLFTLGSFALGVSPIIHLFAQLFWVWLLRALYVHSGVIIALADLVLILLTAFWALMIFGLSGSVLLSVWGFFIVQSIHIYLPSILGIGKRSEEGVYDLDRSEDRFHQSFQSAEAALRELASRV